MSDIENKAIDDLRTLLGSLTGCSDIDSRDIICTPCGGNYGQVEAWVCAVNGSPARGIIFIGQNRYTGADDVFLIDQGRSRRLGSSQAEIVRRFETAFLGGPDTMISDAIVKVITGKHLPCKRTTK